MIPLDIPSSDRLLRLEEALGDNLEVHDLQDRGEAVVFRGRFRRSPQLLYAEVAPRFKALGYQAVLRREGARDLVIAYPAQPPGRRSSPWLHLLLFGLTVLSTGLAGTMLWLGEHAAELGLDPAGSTDALQLLRLTLAHWTQGLPFTAALLGILGVHEFGHYFMARHYRLDVSLPYFIPFPLNTFTGTLGAVIKIQSPFESRKALFDVGIAGPLAGLAVAVPVVLVGLGRAELVTIAPTASSISFGEPLLFQALAYLVLGPRPPGQDILMNPLLMAGWWGFFITALNLLPLSQLDGGHIAYGLLGKGHRLLARAFFVAAALLVAVASPGYLVMLLLVLYMGLDHPPAMDDLSPIGPGRQVLGWLTLLLFFLLFTPVPLSALG